MLRLALYVCLHADWKALKALSRREYMLVERNSFVYIFKAVQVTMQKRGWSSHLKYWENACQNATNPPVFWQ